MESEKLTKKTEIREEIEIPEGINFEVNEGLVSIEGNKGKIERKFVYPNVNIEKQDKKISLYSKKISKRENKMIKTFKAHMKNMIQGATEEFEYTLKVCSSHFPMTVTKERDLIMIKNFLGEKIPRKAKILEGVNVEINGGDLTVKGINKELAGQTAANIELACKVRKRDRRIFSDGIYITKKNTKEI
jgi:large subunit ribosomal protein L6|tara:strand:- start:7835 stop:8398 length:564 start_codon:yes stop_codon:yes gene_type:complete